MNELLVEGFVYLLAAVVAVPIAKRLGLGSVLGYLIAGVAIGPVLGIVYSGETQELQHFAEFGVVMMLFLVGLELEPKALWDMRGKLLGLGGLQVLGTAALVTGIALAFGQPWQFALAIGLVLCLSSTAIVLQTLNEKGLMKSEGGQSSFSVLLTQDIAVIPMLALLPLLAVPELIDAYGAGADAGAGSSAGPSVGDAIAGGGAEVGHGADVAGGDHSGDGGHGGPMAITEGLPPWQVALLNLAAIGAIVVGGNYLSRPLFRWIGGTGMREVFTAATLLLVIAIALLMTLVGLSPALGTFLAGVLLANSEYRHEIESDIEPFKGLLLGLFFITVGAGIDFAVLGEQLVLVLGLTFGTMALKAGILYAIAVTFGITGSDRWLFALGLAQAGEFGFVLISVCLQNDVLPAGIADVLLLVVALSMLLTPLLFILFERVIAPRAAAGQVRENDTIDEVGTTIIAGHGRFGQVVNRLLLSNGYTTTLLEHKAELIEGQRKFGTKVFYGDATRPDLLEAAGLRDAKLLVVAIDDEERALKLIEHARRERPDIHIVARAFDRRSVYRMYRGGTDDIVREVFDSSVRAGRCALEALGMHPYEAEKAAATLVERDKDGLRRLAPLYRDDVSIFDNDEYIDLAKQIRDELERAMRGAGRSRHDHTEKGWVPPGNTNVPEKDGGGTGGPGPRDATGAVPAE